MSWGGIINFFENLQSSWIDPQLKRDMADLATVLCHHPSFADIKPSTSHVMLTLQRQYSATEGLITAGWEQAGFYRVQNLMRRVSLENSIQTLRDCLRHVRDLQALDKTLSIGKSNLEWMYGKSVGWENVLEFYSARQHQVDAYGRFAQNVLDLLPKLMVIEDFEDVEVWTVPCMTSLVIDPHGSERSIGIALPFAQNHEFSIYEQITVTASQAIPILEDFVNRL